MFKAHHCRSGATAGVGARAAAGLHVEGVGERGRLGAEQLLVDDVNTVRGTLKRVTAMHIAAAN